MSRFSMRCDLYDTIYSIGRDYKTNKECFEEFLYETDGKIFAGDGSVIHFSKPSDLVKYYPYVIGAMSCTKGVRGGCHIWLAKESELRHFEGTELGLRIQKELQAELLRLKVEEQEEIYLADNVAECIYANCLNNAIEAIQKLKKACLDTNRDFNTVMVDYLMFTE